MFSLDYGADTGKLRVCDENGPVELPKPPRGLTPDQKFAWTLEWLLARGDVVTESPTAGSSGADPQLINKVVQNSSHTLYTLPARAVKNYVKDHNLPKPDDAECARILYEIATTNPAALRVWQYTVQPMCPTCGQKQNLRKYRSVRPYDKRNYKDPAVDARMANLAPFELLSPESQRILGNGLKRHPDYARARVLPFAMALEEEGADTRAGYEKIIGLYGHGYPSFYRRASVSLMQRVAKDLAGVSKIDQVTKEQRKEAWRVTRRHIRELYRVSSKAHQIPDEGHMPSLF